MQIAQESIDAGDATVGTAATNESFLGVELELALDLQDPSEEGFDECVRAAAAVVGGELLFDMPSDGAVEDALRIAAVRVAANDGDAIVFAVLNGEGNDIRVCDRQEIGERFYGFARAFVGVLTRIRDDLSFGIAETEGSA